MLSAVADAAISLIIIIVVVVVVVYDKEKNLNDNDNGDDGVMVKNDHIINISNNHHSFIPFSHYNN